MKWKEFGIDIAERNQLKNPSSILIDDDETIYIVDSQNDRILKWKFNEHYNEIVAGGHGKGKQLNQLIFPKDVIIDKENDCFIISDYENKRIVQWSCHNNEIGQIVIPNISCQGLAIDKYGFIYVADSEKHAVRKWKIGDPIGKLVAGGNGKGTYLNQLNHPSFIFVDNDCSLYISDCANHRVMKWLKDAQEGIIVAGGNGEGNSFKQLAGPQGIFVDQFNQIYVADHGNNRVMCWYEGATKGNIVVGRNGYGNELNQLFYPMGLSFDQQGNLYVVDSGNNRIQKFEIDLN
jgi:sugar lactone lactonase YvrE